MSQAPQPLYQCLIRRSLQLQRLCERAANRVIEPGLKAVLEENAQSLRRLVVELQLQLTELRGTPAARERWGEWLALSEAMRARRDATRGDVEWIRLLARYEAVLLRTLEDGISHASPEAAFSLRQLLPRLRSVHSDMHGLAQAAR